MQYQLHTCSNGFTHLYLQIYTENKNLNLQ